jgi:hypothetical protein
MNAIDTLNVELLRLIYQIAQCFEFIQYLRAQRYQRYLVYGNECTITMKQLKIMKAYHDNLACMLKRPDAQERIHQLTNQLCVHLEREYRGHVKKPDHNQYIYQMHRVSNIDMNKIIEWYSMCGLIKDMEKTNELMKEITHQNRNNHVTFFDHKRVDIEQVKRAIEQHPGSISFKVMNHKITAKRHYVKDSADTVSKDTRIHC